MVPLRTPRLTLRAPELADAPALSAGSSPLEVARWTERIPHPNPPEAVAAFLASARAEGREVRVIDDGAPAGMIGLEPDLGYWLAPRAQGRGLATEAAAALLAHAFAGGAEEIGASVFDGNARSARVLAKLGFVATGARGRARPASTGEAVETLALRLTRAAFAAAAPALPLTAAARAGMAAP